MVLKMFNGKVTRMNLDEDPMLKKYGYKLTFSKKAFDKTHKGGRL